MTRWLLVLIVGAQLVGKLYDPSNLEEILLHLETTVPAGLLLPGLVGVDLLLLGLLLYPRSLRAGLVACGGFFGAVAVLLVTHDLHIPEAACRGLYLWNGTGSGPAALYRTTALSGIALLGATWPQLGPPPTGGTTR